MSRKEIFLNFLGHNGNALVIAYGKYVVFKILNNCTFINLKVIRI